MPITLSIPHTYLPAHGRDPVTLTHVKIQRFSIEPDARRIELVVAYGKPIENGFAYAEVPPAIIPIEDYPHAMTFGAPDPPLAYSQLVAAAASSSAGANLYAEVSAQLYAWLLANRPEYEGEIVQ